MGMLPGLTAYRNHAKEGVMGKSVGLAFTLSAISAVIGIGNIDQSIAQETQRLGTTDTSLDKSVGREGGQSGRSPHLEKWTEASRSKAEGRIGGQAGVEAHLHERMSSYGSMGATRVGGQAGVEHDVGKPSDKVK